MSEKKWTPGPWAVDYDNDAGYDGGFWEWYNAGPSKVEVILNDDDLAKANAHLIAAAPELYEALEAMLSLWGSVMRAQGFDPDHVVETAQARAALAKAQGESK